MNLHRTLAVVEKEWMQTFKNGASWSAVILPPVIITGLLLCGLYQFRKNLNTDVSKWVLDYLLMFFVAMPAVNAARIAASGIMADKASRSLEPLLATPLAPGELIAGKVAVAAVPPVLVAWISCVFFIICTRRWGMLQSILFGQTTGWLCLFTVLATTLLLTLSATLIGFVIAAGKVEVRSATLSATGTAEFIMLLPLAGIYGGLKYHIAGTTWALAATGGLSLVNVILFLIGVKLFQRESVLFKWK